MKLFSLILATASFVVVSCERHEFEGKNGTKQLNENHANHGEAAGHGEAKEHTENPGKAEH